MQILELGKTNTILFANTGVTNVDEVLFRAISSLNVSPSVFTIDKVTVDCFVIAIDITLDDGALSRGVHSIELTESTTGKTILSTVDITGGDDEFKFIHGIR